ncbi:3D-(3,5/4)-trihydroxycyclohexane-1,2-dione hydrolase [Pokkaliibacter plantistimulans]|uniref:3D-(3,5/4)-trihydroxycyclohexane-1,2-dione hydrolase n=1 Tax=Pokkaliibacter plantistimulans TaxID=1635171 RepID=A0ABX5LUW7_9GAMM|nr:3D-(3,5/4)-trihydroxycyclohexane-1,2-dione acylhydrolase (decyclizing) [Pokkaliibacter plantistimulans]PXF30017.1 3D-(3,5/4)-trihydroxycyclohexane-1,2-dione hydrolase [Pokkaliibacter plantistimulans]
MSTIRLTMAQALVKFLQAQYHEVDGKEIPLFAGMFAIFGHGNVAGIGEALHAVRNEFPTYRAHNEQGMALAATAFAKQNRRTQILACTTSIGPGAMNMLTAAGVAHVNRLPLLLLPGDTFSTRTPDPVLQQVEDSANPGVTVNDCFRPVSRYFDRIHRPEQLITSLPAAMRILTDPVDCGPATIALPQDIQAEAYDYPESFFRKRVHRLRRPQADVDQLSEALAVLRCARKPMIIAGGGVHYAGAVDTLRAFVEKHHIPVAESQAGKGVLPWDHPQLLGAIGVTGTSAANHAAQEADVVLAIGTRLQDFTTGSRTVFGNPDVCIIGLNVAAFDAYKHESLPLVADAKTTLGVISQKLGDWQSDGAWQDSVAGWIADWMRVSDAILAAPTSHYLPTDANVIGAVWRNLEPASTLVCAAGGLPGELHKLWRPHDSQGYHLEYGFSCMGYEIAGALGAKMATPDREVVVLVGDGSYLMLNSEIATSVMLGYKLIIVVLDNRGYACINRLQQACGGAPFNNLLEDCLTVEGGAPKTDFAAHARAMGAASEQVTTIAELEQAMARAKASPITYVIAIDTDAQPSTAEGGHWWDVAVPEVSVREQVRTAYTGYKTQKTKQPY